MANPEIFDAPTFANWCHFYDLVKGLRTMNVYTIQAGEESRISTWQKITSALRETVAVKGNC